MNVVIVNDNAHVNGGAAKVAIASALGLAKRNWRVYLFSAVGPVSEDLTHVENLEVLCTDQFEILADPNRLRALSQGLWNRVAASQFRSLLDKLDRDQTIIHVHTWAKSLSSSVVRLVKELRFHSVLTLHDYLYSCPSGTLFNHKKQQICHLQPMSAQCIGTNCDARNYAHKLWRVGRQSIQDRSFRDGFQHFVALTKGSLDILRPSLPPNANVRFISNFVDAPKLPRVRVEQNRGFVFSGRLVPEKGPALLARAARDAAVPVVFIGDGPGRDDIAHANAEARITGWLSYQDGLKHLQSARALVLPSLWYEAQPLVILEALALGIPVIVPDQCAARELVIDGETGLWFRTGDQRDLTDKILRLTRADLACQMSLAAYDRYWSDPPTLDKHLDALECLYTSVLQN